MICQMDFLLTETSEDVKFHTRRKWHRYLSNFDLSWDGAKGVAQRFGCSLPPPYNPWFLDLPYEWLPTFYNEISSAKIEEMRNLRIGR